MLGLNQLHSGTQLHSRKVFHLELVTFCQRVQLRDQDSKRQTSLEKTTTLFGTEALKHKFNILAEEAKKSEDISIQELEECQAFKWLPSAEDAAALSGFGEGLSQRPLFSEWWSRADFIEWPFGPPSDVTQQKQKQCLVKPVDVMRYFWKNVDSSKVLHVSAPRHVRTFFFFQLPRVARRLYQVTMFHKVPTQ